jgi:hypothetical protein
MESSRNAWVALAAWFCSQGATVVLVPPEQSADLRAYYTEAYAKRSVKKWSARIALNAVA